MCSNKLQYVIHVEIVVCRFRYIVHICVHMHIDGIVSCLLTQISSPRVKDYVGGV